VADRGEAAADAAGKTGSCGQVPTVSVIVPVLNEATDIESCLLAIEAQTYPGIVEILVADGGSTDRTAEIAVSHARVRVLDNPGRLQAAGLNVALAEATGEVVVRVDGHSLIHPDYVERCVTSLATTGAAMVGGMMVPAKTGGWVQRAIGVAMSSRLGAGPARFHVGGAPGWVDTVYLGCYRADVAREKGGYDPAFVLNEDAEFAVRMREAGGVWFDPAIRATYVPRGSVPAVARQFFRYGKARAGTVRRHPASLSARQLAPPLLLLGLVSPWRRWIGLVYAGAVSARAAAELRRDPPAAGGLLLILPTMHLPWALGFLIGLASPQPGPSSPAGVARRQGLPPPRLDPSTRPASSARSGPVTAP
jgi:glycosyltransferase involved in cell wall biosynthesis